MATWDAWFPDVLVHAPAAPDPLVRQALCRAARDFLRRTRVWMVWLDPVPTVAGARVAYEFVLPAESQIVRVEQASINGRPLDVQSYRLRQADWTRYDDGEPAVVTRDLAEFILSGTAAAGDEVQVQVSLMPTLAATGIPDDLADRYLEPIARGALSVLLATPDVPFYKPDLAAAYGLMFEQAINTVAVDAYRGHTNEIPRARPKWV